jgi:hypothetical protein
MVFVFLFSFGSSIGIGAGESARSAIDLVKATAILTEDGRKFGCF